jgi:two-component system response regulator FlrC
MSQFYTVDERMKNLLTLAENIAASKASVLINGESGVGKEVLAKYIHEKSNRRNRPFVAVNCAALPDTLLESELFGYEKGAFTGAETTKIGKFEAANGGTFLLDEVGDLPLQLQGKLLRVLQEGEIERLGSNQVRKVDIRVIAATHKNINEMVANGTFRKDLYYRLNVIPLGVPALRERTRDIVYLAHHFVEKHSPEHPPKLSREAIQALLNWHWPGNARELENVIERAVLMCQGPEISPHHIHVEQVAEPNSPFLRAGMTIAAAEQSLILKTLEFTGNNKTRAADLLGISIRTLRNKLNDYRQSGVAV